MYLPICRAGGEFLLTARVTRARGNAARGSRSVKNASYIRASLFMLALHLRAFFDLSLASVARGVLIH